MNKISVITRTPIADSNFQFLLLFLRHPRHFLKLLLDRKKISGHPAVTASLINGLKNVGVKFNYDPICTANINETVVVLSGVDVLKFCINLRKQGHIKVLFAGPNIVVHANEAGCILGDESIDKILVPAEWVKCAYEAECAKTKGRILVWPCGVDLNKWIPGDLTKSSTVLLYKKVDDIDLPQKFYENITKSLINNGFTVIELKYGEYHKADYRDILANCCAMIYVSKTESQGLALLESWAMDVPTFVWESGCREIDGYSYKHTSSAPYLTNKTGVFWKNPGEVGRLILNLNSSKLAPRKWVEDNMTDYITSNNLVKEIRNIYNKV